MDTKTHLTKILDAFKDPETEVNRDTFREFRAFFQRLNTPLTKWVIQHHRESVFSFLSRAFPGGYFQQLLRTVIQLPDITREMVTDFDNPEVRGLYLVEWIKFHIKEVVDVLKWSRPKKGGILTPNVWCAVCERVTGMERDDNKVREWIDTYDFVTVMRKLVEEIPDPDGINRRAGLARLEERIKDPETRVQDLKPDATLTELMTALPNFDDPPKEEKS